MTPGCFANRPYRAVGLVPQIMNVACGTCSLISGNTRSLNH